jgi:Alpha/beta hydrolase domain
LSTLESIFTTLQSGAITNTALRTEGLCLLEGYYKPLSAATLRALYPTHSACVNAFTSAAASDLVVGFLTPTDYAAAIAAAQASSVP